MSDSPPDPPRPPRRKRYAGTHPRRFHEKYKELDPNRDPDTVAKVIASGKTPAGSHLPIMVEECLEALALRSAMRGVDATLGHGAHAVEILRTIGPEGRLLGLDQDPIELPRSVARLAGLGFESPQFEARRSNYAGVAKVLAEIGWGAVDFLFADLGCSSMQLDDPERGFSYKVAGPLDMRMNPGRGLSARDWLARVKAERLERTLQDHADEPAAATLAEALAGRDFPDTLALARAVREALDHWVDDEVERSLRRVFQAVRIAVNEEFTSLDALLRVLPNCLKPGGRVAILTFHSGEDRRVKQAFKQGLHEGAWSEISDGVITPGPREIHRNPRSRSAKLRWARRA